MYMYCLERARSSLAKVATFSSPVIFDYSLCSFLYFVKKSQQFYILSAIVLVSSGVYELYLLN